MNRFFFLCFLTVPLWADVELQHSINDVYYRGDHQLAGSITFTTNGNDFADASPENPMFIRVLLEDDAVLADTRVDQRTDGLVISQPIYMACELVSVSNYTLAIVPEAVSIVRWVGGEKEFWFKVQTATDTWLQDAQGQSVAPDENAKVSWTVGISARSSVADHSVASRSSMRSNSRSTNPQTDADATSTLLCLDLTNSTMELGRSLGEFIFAYGPEAEVSIGEYEPINKAEIHFVGDFEIARGKDLKPVDTRLVSGTVNLQPLTSQQLLLQADLVFALTQTRGASLLNQNLYNGATLRLTSPDTGGFSEDGAWFREGCNRLGLVQVVAHSAFESSGSTYYREIVLVWHDDQSWNGSRDLEDAQLSVGLTLTVPAGYSDETPRIIWSLSLPQHSGGFDNAPFDGPDQLRRCSPMISAAGEGTWQPINETSFHLAHITEPGKGYTTSLLFSNNHEQGHGYLVKGYDANGASLGSVIGSLEAGVQRLESASDLLDNPALSHLRMAATDDVRLTAIYQAEGEGKAPAHLGLGSETATNWLVKLGDPSLTFDAIALVNMGDSPSKITVSEIDSSGGTITSFTLTEDLVPMAKLLHLFAPSAEGNAYLIQASQKSAVIALRGSHDSTLIWENRAEPFGN